MTESGEAVLEIIDHCKCCGGPAACEGDQVPGFPLAGAFVRCTVCDLSTTIFDSRALAIAAWNRRPGDAVAAPVPVQADARKPRVIITPPEAPADPQEAIAALTPMFLANAAFCIEAATTNYVTEEIREATIWKLIHAAEAMKMLNRATSKTTADDVPRSYH